MAMESPALYSAAISLASGHLSLSDPSYKVTALQAQSAAMRSLASAITLRQSSQHDFNTATCLLLLISDVRVGESRYWYGHLKAAKHFIVTTPEHSASGRCVAGPEALLENAEGQWALHIFIYYDIMSAITRQRSPLLYKQYIAAGRNILFTCFPMLGATLSFIAKICHLQQMASADRRVAAGPDHATMRRTTFQAAAARIEAELHSWSCRPGIPAPLAAVSHAYHGAAFILLYRLKQDQSRAVSAQPTQSIEDDVEEESNDKSMPEDLQAKIRMRVSEVLQHVAKVPVGTPVESNLLAPLFIAGWEATDQKDIAKIRARLSLLFERLAFANISRAIGVLEDLWKLRKTHHEEGTTNWSQILDASRGYVLLV